MAIPDWADGTLEDRAVHHVSFGGAMLSVAFLGIGGALSTRSLEAVSRRHRIVAVVESSPRKAFVSDPMAALRRTARRWKRGPGELARLSAMLGVPHWQATVRNDPTIARALRRIRPDIMCIAGYQWVLPPELYTIPRLGAINLHMSLLPRHRGFMPLFWLYHADDRQAGVTVHWVAERADAGDIIRQEAFPLERGCPIERVHARCAELGSQLVSAALDAIDGGSAPRVVQDERLATPAPKVRPGDSIVDFDAWDVERVWHVLAGLFPMFRAPLTDEAGLPFRYGAVLGYDRVGHAREPGSLEKADGRYSLYCRGGTVHLAGRAP